MSDVVCVEEGDLGGTCEAATAEHFDVSPGDKKNGGAAKRSGGNGVDRVATACCNKRVRREERCEVFSNANRANARTTTTMGTRVDIRAMVTKDRDNSDVHSEGLVQVHVADITTADRRVCQPDLRIKVGTVQIDLTPVVVDDLARVLHTVFENSEC